MNIVFELFHNLLMCFFLLSFFVLLLIGESRPILTSEKLFLSEMLVLYPVMLLRIKSLFKPR